MEDKLTRKDKYKDLRDQLEEGQPGTDAPVEDADDTEDDFLDFLPKHSPDVVDPDDGFRAMSYDTLEEDEAVRTAIARAKTNIGKEESDTRMEIYNRLRKDTETVQADDGFSKSDLEEGHDVTNLQVEREEEGSAAAEPYQPSKYEETGVIRVFEFDADAEKTAAYEKANAEEEEEIDPESLTRRERRELKKKAKQEAKEEKRRQKEEAKARKDEETEPEPEPEEETPQPQPETREDDGMPAVRTIGDSGRIEDDEEEEYEDEEQPKKGIGVILLDVIIIILVVLLAGMCYLYFQDLF